MSRAMTMVELLIVVAIVLVLTGLLFPIATAARRSALNSVDAASLRQLGMARQLYMHDFDESPVYVSPTLVAAGYAPPSLCSSPSEGTPEGIANQFRSLDEFDHLKPVSYRDSYLGLGEVVGLQLIEEMTSQSEPGLGWLVSLGQSVPRDPTTPGRGAYDGLYLRLTLDGAVIVRKHQWQTKPDGGQWASMTWWFMDRQP